MNAIKIIEDKLKKHPQLKYETAGNRISIEPLTSDGFSVWFIEKNLDTQSALMVGTRSSKTKMRL